MTTLQASTLIPKSEFQIETKIELNKILEVLEKAKTQKLYNVRWILTEEKTHLLHLIEDELNKKGYSIYWTAKDDSYFIDISW